MQISASYLSSLYSQQLTSTSKTTDSTSTAVTAASAFEGTQTQTTATAQQSDVGAIKIALSNNLLSSGTVSQLNQLQEDTSTTSAATATETSSSQKYITDDDIAYLEKISGCQITVNSDGSVQILNSGNLSDDQLKNLTRLEGQIDTDRQCGNLIGSISEAYLENLFAQSDALGSPYDSDFEQKALAQV